MKVATNKNVRPLSEPGSLGPRAVTLLNRAQWSGDVTPELDRQYIVKGWLDRATISVVYGPSNVGKSFFAVDVAHHVSKGMAWGNRRTRKGRVLYLAAEGGGNFINRVAALDDPQFWLMCQPITLTGRETQAQPLAEVMDHLAQIGGERFDLIILDTMARVMGGLDENAAPDIADLVRNLDVIRTATGAHVMLIHHTGKDAARGARGHSSLRAAVDTEIELTRDDFGTITAEVTKQRDGPTGYRFEYRLRQVELGEDQDGDPVTTCVVEPALPMDGTKAAIPETAQKALAVLSELLSEPEHALEHTRSGGALCVRVEQWAEACALPDVISASAESENRRRMWRKSRDQLVTAGLIRHEDGLVWKVGAP